jgi:hypothetical protein
MFAFNRTISLYEKAIIYKNKLCFEKVFLKDIIILIKLICGDNNHIEKDILSTRLI